MVLDVIAKCHVDFKQGDSSSQHIYTLWQEEVSNKVARMRKMEKKGELRNNGIATMKIKNGLSIDQTDREHPLHLMV
jgi:hypothetical protein